MNPPLPAKTSEDDWRSVALMMDYAFGRGAGKAVPLEALRVTRSKRSGRIKLVHHGARLFATIKPNGSVALSIDAARALSRSPVFRANCVEIVDDVVPFVKGGRSVFCKFVRSAGRNVFPKSEVIVVDGTGRVVGVGMATMNGTHMRQFKSGAAVKVRAGLGK